MTVNAQVQYVDASGRLTVAGVQLLTNIGRVLPPVLTTTQRNAYDAQAGEIIFNSTTGKLNFYTGSAWEAVTST